MLSEVPDQTRCWDKQESHNFGVYLQRDKKGKGNKAVWG